MRAAEHAERPQQPQACQCQQRHTGGERFAQHAAPVEGAPVPARARFGRDHRQVGIRVEPRRTQAQRAMLSGRRQYRAEHEFVIAPSLEHHGGAPLAQTGVAHGRKKHLLGNDLPRAFGFRIGGHGGTHARSIPAPQRDAAVAIRGMPALVGKRRELAGALGDRARPVSFRDPGQIEAREHADIRSDQAQRALRGQCHAARAITVLASNGC